LFGKYPDTVMTVIGGWGFSSYLDKYRLVGAGFLASTTQGTALLNLSLVINHFDYGERADANTDRATGAFIKVNFYSHASPWYVASPIELVRDVNLSGEN
jgi:hypothetical protein